ncbi:uncharacterized protein [Antedon mediterranea]|uniref:uncharacterized protein n=1 Tax=Antedon mediterranea TaxID=105859 RepID=UPI003AF4C97B
MLPWITLLDHSSSILLFKQYALLLAILIEVERPSVALKLGHNLSKLAAIKRCTALRTGDKVAEQGDKVAEQEAKSFLKLKEAEWAEQISAEVLGTISKRKFKQVTELPESADLSKFTTFLIENIKDATDELKKPSAKTFRRCCQLVLARLTTFNKRRTGETEQLSLESCINRTNWEASMFVVSLRAINTSLLDPATQQIYGHATAFKNSLRKLICRNHLIRSTKMRKYIATVSQILNLKESQLDWLADHLGHSINVHRDYYRLSTPTIELTKVAKLLIAIDNGNVGKFVGKSS